MCRKVHDLNYHGEKLIRVSLIIFLINSQKKTGKKLTRKCSNFSGRSTALRPTNECFEELRINSTITVIESKNYPSNYDNDVHCQWVLQTDR